MWRRHLVWSVLLTFFPCAVVYATGIPLALEPNASAPARITLQFDESSVTATGVEKDHAIVFFGVGIGSHGHAALLRRQLEVVADSDGDGAVKVAVRELPRRSVWVVVDYETGEHVVSTPSETAPALLSFPSDWRGNRDRIEVPRQYLEVLLVRPAKGAWSLRMADGGRNDGDDRQNRVLQLRLDRMEVLLGGAKGPPVAIPRDVLVMIDPQTLDTFVSVAR